MTQAERGGAQRAAYKLLLGFKKNRVQAKLVFLYRKNGSYDSLKDVYHLAHRRPVSFLDHLRLVKNLIAFCFKHRSHTFITFTHYANIIVLPIASLFNVKKRIACQRNPFFSYPLVCRVLDRVWFHIGVYTHVTCNSYSVLGSMPYKTAGLQKISVIYNGISVNPYQNINKSNLFLQEKLKILSVGRLVYQKNQAPLIDLLSYPEVNLIIAGEGPLRSEYQLRINHLKAGDRAMLIGEIPPALLDKLYAECDYIIFTSLFEGMSNAAMEAVAKKCIILTTAEPSQLEIFTLGNGEKCALVLPNDKPSTIYGFLNQLNKDENLRFRLKKNCEQRAKELSTEHMISKFIGLV